MSGTGVRDRCPWAGEDPLMVAYHDQEWGVPLQDDQKLFEFLILEGAQAGLSWLTVLRRRQGYARAFADFDPHVVAAMGDTDVARLLQDASIILSVALSKDLKSRGFSFVGPTIVYAHMQATGLVNDHLVSCFRYAQLAR